MRLYKTQYSFRISGNRGYDSNRVRFLCLIYIITFTFLISFIIFVIFNIYLFGITLIEKKIVSNEMDFVVYYCLIN